MEAGREGPGAPAVIQVVAPLNGPARIPGDASVPICASSCRAAGSVVWPPHVASTGSPSTRDG